MQPIHTTRIARETASRARAAATTPRVASDLGTSAWIAARDGEARETSMRRVEALRAASLARGERDMHDMHAPCMAAPATSPMREVDGVTYDDVDPGYAPLAVRAMIAARRREGQAARRRAAVMAANRMRRAAAIRAARADLEVDLAPRVRINEAAMLHTGLYVTTSRAAARPLDMWTAIEEHILQRDADAAAMASVMASEPSYDGRGTVDRYDDDGRPVGAVNGTETRVGMRWHATPRHAVMTAVETRDGVTCVAPVDWSAYRVHADGTRTPLVSTATATRRKRKAATSKASRVASLQAVATTTGHVEAATS